MPADEQTPANPYQAPTKPENPWRFDRSGVADRVVEIIGVSIVAAILGFLLGNFFFPDFRLNHNSGNLLTVIAPLVGLTIWSIRKMRTMWKANEDNTRQSEAPRQ